MPEISFCEACSVHKVGKCTRRLCPHLRFVDYESFTQLKTLPHCDLLYCNSGRLDFIELKASDRFTTQEGAIPSVVDIFRDTQQYSCAFDSEKINQKFERSREEYLSMYPNCNKHTIRYIFLFSQFFVDYFKQKKNAEVDANLLKLLLLQTIFAQYPANPSMHNGKSIPLIVDTCLQAECIF
ncbi:MAG: hypothetical protein IJ876_06260 [Elusimicrobiaceae bacterium]|nr:hypothetical protein [Elusimicrobiaceae bacterium]